MILTPQYFAKLSLFPKRRKKEKDIFQFPLVPNNRTLKNY